MEEYSESSNDKENLIEWTKKSLSLLEKETWVNFFKKASDWIKSVFSFKQDDQQPLSNVWESRSQDNQFEQSENTGTLKVKETRDYISNWWTFYSPSKWICQWNKYNQVCSTGSFNVLRRLWLPKVSDSTEVDLTWKTLTKMWLKYIGEVNPNNPSQSWYKPQDWDTAVRPKFTRTVWKSAWKRTQHQATYINWHWVSDNIQNRMSCYPGERNEPNCKIYRYMW